MYLRNDNHCLARTNFEKQTVLLEKDNHCEANTLDETNNVSVERQPLSGKNNRQRHTAFLKKNNNHQATASLARQRFCVKTLKPEGRQTLSSKIKLDEIDSISDNN